MKLSDLSLLTGRSYVNGAWTDADGGGTFAVENPSTGETVAEMADLGQAETARAIDAAYAAQKDWAAMLASERCALVMKLHDLMVENADDLATILTAEMGKPWAEARGEVLVRRLLHPVVRRGGQARLWRHDPAATSPASASW